VTLLFRSVNPADGEEFARYGKMSWREADAVLDHRCAGLGDDQLRQSRS